jgi:hypothetical protein
MNRINETIITALTVAPTTMPAIPPRLRPVSPNIESTIKLKEDKGLLKQI